MIDRDEFVVEQRHDRVQVRLVKFVWFVALMGVARRILRWLGW